MHPNPVMHWDDAAAMRTFVAARGFAHIFASTPAGPMVEHAPLTLAGEHFRFHLARRNRLHAHLDGATVLASVAGPDGYVSPDWYAEARDQVPTWNYVTVEIEGVAHALNEAALRGQLDVLAEVNEAGLAPKPPWTIGKAAPARIAMLRAIQGFELRVTALRGTRKLSQNKNAADRAGAILGLRGAGRDELADLMEAE